MLPSEILQRAKDSLTLETWGKGLPAERLGTLCAMEAIAQLNAPYAFRLSSSHYLTAAIGYRIGYRSITSWNDAPERTLEEVHAAFDKAIAAAKEAGQ